MRLLNVNRKKTMQTKASVIILGCFVVPTLIFSACKKQTEETGECIGYTTAQVIEVTGPNMVLVNQETDYKMKFYLTDGCGNFENVESTSNGYTITISLIAKYKGCICTQVLLYGETSYKFKPTQTGIYYLKFIQPNKTHFIDTVTVN
jgi:hypothetical protein